MTLYNAVQPTGSSMEQSKFPVEIWQKIGRDACMDGGRTGCALSLVSRTMRDVMQTVCFTSVAVTSEKGCLSFAELACRRRFTSPCWHLLIWIQSTTKGGPEAFIKDACAAILSYAAPTLVTLSLDGSALSSATEARIAFPVLRDLCAPRHYAYRNPGLDADLFPTLQRLHLNGSGFDGMRAGVGLWDELALFTMLTALRLTGVRREQQLPAFLRILLDVPAPPRSHNKRRSFDYARLEEFAVGSPDAMRSLQLVAQFPRLMYITTQPQSARGHRWCGNGHTAHRHMKSSLSAIAEATASRNTGSRRLWNLEDSEEYYGLEPARWDWMDVLRGGDGPWPPGSSHFIGSSGNVWTVANMTTMPSG